MKRHNAYHFPFAKYPAVRLALFLAAGIVLSKWFHPSIYCWVIFFGMMTLAWALSEFFLHRHVRTIYSSAAITFYISAIVLFGSFWHTLRSHDQSSPSAKLLSAYTWQPIQINGSIQNIKQTSTGKYQLDVNVQRTVLEDSLIWHVPYTLRAILDPKENRLPDNLDLGTIIVFSATVYPLEEPRNPYQFDYKSYLASQHIYSQVGIKNMNSVHPSDSGWLSWLWWRRQTLQQIDHNFTPETAPLAKALLIGYKNELERGKKITFSRAGLSHIMAVSGLHVGFLIAPFWFLIPFLWSTRLGKIIGFSIFCLVLYFYAGLTGFSPSVTRASIMGGLLVYGRLFNKASDPKNLAAVAALIILLINPDDLFAIGFQLSFAAVYIILLILPVLRLIIPSKIEHRWYGTPIMVVLVSLVVQFGLYPLLSYYFGEFSLIGPLANAVIVPWLAFMIPYALFLLPLAALLPTIVFYVNAPCRWFLYFLDHFVNATVAINGSWIQTPSIGMFIFVIWLAAIFFIAALPDARIRWKALIILLVVCSAQQVYSLIDKLRPPELIITMLDVGQGDATFVTTPSGKHFLIDTGRWTPGYNSGKYIIMPYLKALGVQKLDAVFLSHPHADHIGGIAELINHIKIDTLYNSGQSYDSKLFARYHRLAKAKDIPIKSLHAGMEVSLDPAMDILIYGPSRSNHDPDVNEHSLVMELIYNNIQFLFMGDAGADEEQSLEQHYGTMLDTDFLKVGHHGSRTASSTSFLNIATPQYEAVSLGLHNRYHHPHMAAIHRLADTHAKLLYTSLSGALEFRSDGSQITYISH